MLGWFTWFVGITVGFELDPLFSADVVADARIA